jgi:hypothetical protein
MLLDVEAFLLEWVGNCIRNRGEIGLTFDIY